MTRARRMAGDAFKSLHTRNYRLYFVGQIISVSGTWMQSVAQSWLVLELAPHRQQGLDLGIVVALQFLPMLLLGPWGGLAADRLDRRRLLFATQISAGALALALGSLTAAGVVRLADVFALAFGLGLVNLFDNPARQTFVLEMVGREDVTNAVSLNGTLMNASRIIGPALAGLLISTVGVTVCFYVNAASYAAVVVALAMMRRAELQRTEPVARAKGQLRAGLAYAWRTEDLRDPLIIVFVVGLLAYNFTVLLPLLAKLTFHGGALTFSALTSMMAAGAVLGGLVAAARNRPSLRRLAVLGVGFGVLITALAAAPDLVVALIVIVPMGALSIGFITTANSTIQLRVDPAMRGRVMALYAIGFLGTAPIGGPLVGWIAQTTSPRVALAIGAAATIAVSLAILGRTRRRARSDLASTLTTTGEDVELGVAS